MTKHESEIMKGMIRQTLDQNKGATFRCSCGRNYESEFDAMCCSICEEAGLMPSAGQLTREDIFEVDGVLLEEDTNEQKP